MANITINKLKVEQQKGVVVLPIKEYQKLLERAVPTYYLTGQEAKKLDKLVKRGFKEHLAGKTIEAPSLMDALSKYRRNDKR